MEAHDTEYLLKTIRVLADELKQSRATERDSKWACLKERLIRTPKFKFTESYLDDNRTQVFELFTQCLLDSSSAVPSIVSGFTQTVPAWTQVASTSSVSSPENPPTRLVANKKAQVDDGFIRIPNKMDPVGARFSYSNKDHSRISRDFVYREGLLPLVGENKTITLAFWLHDSKPKKSYKIEFKVQKQAQFDVSLGSNWNQEKWNQEEESASRSLSALRIRQPSPVPISHTPMSTSILDNNKIQDAIIVLTNTGVQSWMNSNRGSTLSTQPFIPVAPTGLRHEPTFVAVAPGSGSNNAHKNPSPVTLPGLDSAEDSGGRGSEEMPALTEDETDDGSEVPSSFGTGGDRIYPEDREARQRLEDLDDPYFNAWAY